MITAVWNAKAELEQYKNKQIFDCMLAEYILNQGRITLSLENALNKYKVNTLEQLYEKQSAELEKIPAAKKLYEEIEMPVMRVLWQMEKNGITLDTARLQQLGKDLEREIEKIKQEILADADTEINLASPMQVGKMLVEKYKVPLKKKPSGQYSTGEPELAKLTGEFPIIQKILKYRELSKLKSTYVESLIVKIGDDNKIHTTYNQAVAISGRLSSSNPNLQNIPVTSEEGKNIKSCFVASPGKVLISFDYSQQELRVLAHLTREPALIEAFKTDKDIHRLSASQLFNTEYTAVTKEQRSVAKTINFGIIYGMGSYGLSQVLEMPVKEADTFINKFFATFSKIKTYYDTLLKNAMKEDCVETILGRKRFIFAPGASHAFIDNMTRRELINFPVQGSAADLMKMAMIEIDKAVLQKKDQIKLLLQIHDELIFEIEEMPEPELELFKTEIKNIMEHVYPLIVPMKVETKIGKSWGEMI